MKVAKIVFLLFVFLIISCDKKDDGPYPDPDGSNLTDQDTVVDEDNEKGALGDPCKFNSDCLSHLKCEDGFCIEDVVDEDTDKTTPDEVDFDETDEDIDEVADNFSDDPYPDDNDEDVADDEQTNPDSDIPLGVCGNGRTEVGEECDNGAYNSDEPGKIGVTCRTNCLLAKCGDSIIDNPYEICDDGNSEENDYCSANCMAILGSCGDGKQQGNEECDKASAGEGIGEYCSNDCLSIVGSCGDGIKQSHEKCDNAEFDDGIGPFYCSSDCMDIIGICGDKIRQDNEGCDDGEDNGRYGFCASDCSGPGRRCGDGVKDVGYEQCDDGNSEDDDYCTTDCQTILGRCGDGVIQPNEECDKAIFGAGTGTYCSDDCLTVLGECGDETLQDNEQCDWGDANGSPFCEYGIEESCSTCNSVCNFVPGQSTFCGDGKIDVQNGEMCDNAESGVGSGQGIGAYCSFDCKTVTGSCGDGVVQGNEVCDKATFYEGIGPEYCASDCLTIIAFCGDGSLQSIEDCDEGTNNTDSCDYGETSCTVCSTQCKNINGKVSYCGDGKNNPTDEFCDSGVNNGEYRTAAPGYCNVGCQGIGAGGYCGDGIPQTPEDCDNGEDNGASECEYGTETCDVCTPGCEIAPATGKFCGDDLITDGEKCDDGGDNGTYGHCKSDCTGMGESCGNGVIDGSEFCDEGENNGLYGHCNSTCTAIKECGDEIKQLEETCDSGVDNGAYRLEAPGNCNSDCQGVGEAGYCGNSVVETGNEECDHGGLITTDCVYGETECTVCNNECQEQVGNVSYCGDGAIQLADGETCDDGANNGNYGYCASDCKSMEEYCGDDIINGTEDCDDGPNNGLYGYCKSDCSGMGLYCGDGVQNGGEICDHGVDNGKYGFCKADCTGLGERCGDSLIQSGDGETCDNGVDNGTYGYCNSECTAMGPYCGDGSVTDGETCDDGANNGNYGFCNAECSDLGVRCGDGVLQTVQGEICDDGGDNGTYGHCKADCSGQGPYCGDELVTDGETCDDGSLNGDYDKCNETCDGDGPYCGDGGLQGDEVCDDGVNNGTYDHCAGDCSGPGLRCGDGEINGGEICDNGILNGSEGYCNENCTGMVEYCDDNIINNGEDCDNGEDNGNTKCDYGETSCDVCTNSCTIVPGLPKYCGDGIKQSSDGEVCDSGGSNGTYGNCAADCKSRLECGDGTINGPEDCDDGDDNGLYGYCKIDCTGMGPYCGDGDITDGEICDDGENNGLPGYCNSSCTDTLINCGNGLLEGGEACDDGENNGQPGYCLSDCSGYDVFCGNGIIQTGELCDDGSNNGQYDSVGEGYCNSDCNGYNEGGYCGDGSTQATYEECDEGPDNGLPDHCTSECKLPTDCGDGTIDEGEFCDTAEINCSDFAQFSSGTIPCPSDCSAPDFSGCVDDPAYISPFFITSQTECYNDTAIITCPIQGNPFYGQEPQFNYETQIFTVGTDTISESVSGLIWQKDTPSTYTGCTAGAPSGSKCDVGEGWNYCEALSLGGYDDWRLPSNYELSNVINYFETASLLFDNFTNSEAEDYLSDRYTMASMNEGTVITTDKSSIGLVKCVRGEELFRDGEVFESGELLVDILDETAGKIIFWQYDSSQTADDWEAALDYCSNFTIGGVVGGGLSGFRLPTVVELQYFASKSLSKYPQIIDTGTFWTSTTFNADPTNAYTVDFSNGNVSYVDKTGTAFVMCVK